MTKKPYMPFFPDAHMSDTVRLTMEEQGAYFRLLCWMWINGGKLEDNDELIPKILSIHPNKWYKLRPAIVEYFTPYGPHHFTQKRLLKEYQRGNKTKPNTSRNTPRVESINSSIIQEDHSKLGDESFVAALSSNDRVSFVGPRDHPNPSPKPIWINKEEMELAQYCGQRIDPLLRKEESIPFTRELFDHFTRRNLPIPIDFDVVANWIRKGADPQRDVLPAVDSILSEIVRKQYPSPHSWKYFGKTVFHSVKRRKEAIGT